MNLENLAEISIIEDSVIARIARKKLKSRNVAMVLGKKIYLSGVTRDQFLMDKKWVVHELVHIEQFKQHGIIKFLILYFVEWIRNGYYNNKFEVEARKKADDFFLKDFKNQTEQP